jgi:aminopeptidase N
VPSLLRNFSAPVKLDAGYTDDELALLLASDSDAFVRWDAGQGLALRTLLRLIAAGESAGRGGVARPAPGRRLRRRARPGRGGPRLRRARASSCPAHPTSASRWP